MSSVPKLALVRQRLQGQMPHAVLKSLLCSVTAAHGIDRLRVTVTEEGEEGAPAGGRANGQKVPNGPTQPPRRETFTALSRRGEEGPFRASAISTARAEFQVMADEIAQLHPVTLVTVSQRTSITTFTNTLFPSFRRHFSILISLCFVVLMSTPIVRTG